MNIEFILDTDEVFMFSKYKLFNSEQPSNIDFILITLEVSKLFILIEVREEQ